MSWNRAEAEFRLARWVEETEPVGTVELFGDFTVSVDGEFTVAELRALADVIDPRKEQHSGRAGD